MKIKTKYDINDTVYHIRNKEILKRTIDGIKIFVTSRNETSIAYKLNYVDSPHEMDEEENLFTSPEELMKNKIDKPGG